MTRLYGNRIDAVPAPGIADLVYRQRERRRSAPPLDRFGFCVWNSYSVMGRFPEWMVDRKSGSLTVDDSPENILPRVDLPILAVIVLMSLTAAAVTVE